jgi:hypothetical protein
MAKKIPQIKKKSLKFLNHFLFFSFFCKKKNAKLRNFATKKNTEIRHLTEKIN